MIILDGGLGRQLAAMGAPFHQPEWSAAALIKGPHFVRAVHDAFIAAGADVISTNSYAVVPHHIGEEMFAERGDELLAIASREARPPWSTLDCCTPTNRRRESHGRQFRQVLEIQPSTTPNYSPHQ